MYDDILRNSYAPQASPPAFLDRIGAKAFGEFRSINRMGNGHLRRVVSHVSSAIHGIETDSGPPRTLQILPEGLSPAPSRPFSVPA